MKKSFISAALLLSLVVTACGGAKPSSPEPAPASPGGTGTAQAPQPEPAQPQPPAEQPKPPEPPKPEPRKIPDPVRGIHFSAWIAGSPDLAGPLLKWAKAAGINTVVLEVKAEDGNISWNSDVPLAKEIGANERKIGDIDALVKDLHDQGFWVAGRIVTMNDAYLYKGRPSWGIPGFPGGSYSFMDPKNENVWRYNLDIAQAAVKAGFDEIQFDYIRYPEKLVNGYNKDTTAEYRTASIVGFLKQAVAELHPLGVVVSADVFGLTTSVEQGDDMQIGQDYKQIADVVDYICPMVYPSHYALGTYGLSDPDRYPYETVKNSMQKALDRTPGMPVSKNRPWIQDFTYPKSGALAYGPAEVKAQVQALHELGITSFMLWDPSNKYTRGVDYASLP